MRIKYKFLPITALALAYAFGVPPLAAQAQEDQSPPLQPVIAESIDQASHLSQADANDNDGHSAERSESAAHIKHSEEHGKHDEHGGHGKPVTLFGKQIGDAGQFWLKLVNFLIFGGILFLILKGVLSAAFRARTDEIETKLAQSQKDRLEGESQLRELEARMAGLEQELSGIMKKAEAEAEIEKQRILEAAKAEADQILAQAQFEIDYQRRLAETELRELVAKLAIEGAEARIRQRLQSPGNDSAIRIMDQAIQKIGGAS